MSFLASIVQSENTQWSTTFFLLFRMVKASPKNEQTNKKMGLNIRAEPTKPPFWTLLFP
jgi:hypothetical protein